MKTFSRNLLLVLVASWLASCGLVTSPEEKMEAASASIEDGDYRVDLDVMISTGEGPATPSGGTLSLPSHSAAG